MGSSCSINSISSHFYYQNQLTKISTSDDLIPENIDQFEKSLNKSGKHSINERKLSLQSFHSEQSDQYPMTSRKNSARDSWFQLIISSENYEKLSFLTQHVNPQKITSPITNSNNISHNTPISPSQGRCRTTSFENSIKRIKSTRNSEIIDDQFLINSEFFCEICHISFHDEIELQHHTKVSIVIFKQLYMFYSFYFT